MADGSIRESIGGEHDTFVSIDVYQQSNVDTASALNEDTEADLNTVVEDDWNAAEYEAATDQGFDSEQPLENDMATFMWNLSTNPDSAATIEEEANSESQEMPINEYGLRGYDDEYSHSQTSSHARLPDLNSSRTTGRLISSASQELNHGVDGDSQSNGNGNWSVHSTHVAERSDFQHPDHLLGTSPTGQEVPLSATPTFHGISENNRNTQTHSSLGISAARGETSIRNAESEISADEERKRELDLASRGVTSYELANPFPSDSEEDPTTVILLSRSGDLTSRERRAIRLISAKP